MPLIFIARAQNGHLVVVDCECTVAPLRARAFVEALLTTISNHFKPGKPFTGEDRDASPCAVAVFDSICAPLFRTLDRTRAVPPIARYVSSAKPESKGLKDVPVPCLECPNVLNGVSAAFILRSVFDAEQRPHTVLFTSVVESRLIDVESVVALAPCLLWWLRSLGFADITEDRVSPISLARVLSSLPWNKPNDLFA